MASRLLAATTACLFLGAPFVASATGPDKYGLGARSQGSGLGGVAIVDDATAARVNPAGLSQIRRPGAGISLTWAHENFEEVPAVWWDSNRDGVIDERDPPLEVPVNVDDALGVNLFAGRQVGGKFGVGLTAYIPTARLVRFQTFEPQLPSWFMYSNRPQRYVIAAGAGGQVVKGVSVGVGLDMLAQARFNVLLSIDGQISGDTDGAEDSSDLIGDVVVDIHDLELDLVPAFIPIVGVQIDLGAWSSRLDGLWLGAVYRGEGGLPIEVDVDLQGNVSIEDVGDLEPYVIALVLQGNASLFDHYHPSRLEASVAWRTDKTLSAYVDARFTRWSRMGLNVARVNEVHATSPLVNIDDRFVDGNDHPLPVFSNTLGGRAGMELNLPTWQSDRPWRYLRLTFRGGLGLEPTPLVSQSDETSLLDADRSFFSVGGGVEFWDPFHLVDGPVRFDVFGQYHILARGVLTRSSSEPRAGYPVEGSTIPYGGNIVVVGGQWSFHF